MNEQEKNALFVRLGVLEDKLDINSRFLIFNSIALAMIITYHFLYRLFH